MPTWTREDLLGWAYVELGPEPWPGNATLPYRPEYRGDRWTAIRQALAEAEAPGDGPAGDLGTLYWVDVRDRGYERLAALRRAENPPSDDLLAPKDRPLPVTGTIEELEAAEHLLDAPVTLHLDEGLPVVRGGAAGRGEVLARGASLYTGWPVDDSNYIRRVLSSSARVIIRGVAYSALLLLAAIPSNAAQRHITRPISSIAVKVVSHSKFLRRLPRDVAARIASDPSYAAAYGAWAITHADADSCVAWVDTQTGDVSGAEVAALRACRKVIDAHVDTGADRSGV